MSAGFLYIMGPISWPALSMVLKSVRFQSTRAITGSEVRHHKSRARAQSLGTLLNSNLLMFVSLTREPHHLSKVFTLNPKE